MALGIVQVWFRVVEERWMGIEVVILPTPRVRLHIFLSLRLWSAKIVVMPVAGLLPRQAPRHSARKQRNLAFSLIQRLTKFAEQCGATATSNRVHVKQAVFHAVDGIPFKLFVAEQLNGDVSSIESIARMECPVTMPNKAMLKEKVPESAPRMG